MHRLRFALTALLAAAIVLSGCSSGKKTSSGTGTTTADGGSVTTARRGVGDPVCDSLRSYTDRFSRVNLGLSDPQQLRAAMQEARTAIADAQSRAPDNLKSDLAVLSRALEQLVTTLQQANYDLSKVSLAQIQQLQTPEVTAAADNVNRYLRESC